MNEPTSEDVISLSKMLAQRLERLSADSVWTHRASGARGALLRQLDLVEAQQRQGELTQDHLENLERLMRVGFQMLARAAREI